jgi:hypothetical protein
MKKLLLLFAIFSFITFTTFAQNQETKNMLASIEGQWSVDDHNYVTYQQVIELPKLTKDEIFKNAESYFIYNYSSGKSVIQTKDKEEGLIIAKGLYSNVLTSITGLATVYFDTWHIIKVEIKDGKARITLSLTGYNEKIISMGEPFYYDELPIVNYYPINPDGKYKTAYGQALYYSHLRALDSMQKIEKSLNEGSAFGKDEW